MTGGETPPEVIEVYLCQDVYHCVPSALERQDWDTVQRHLIVLDAKARVSNLKAERRAQAAAYKGHKAHG